MYPKIPSGCWRCGSLMAICRHVWWDCFKIKYYWGMVLQEVERIMGHKMPFSLRIYLLHDLSELNFSNSKKLLLLNLCVAASLLIASKWKSKEIPDKHNSASWVNYRPLLNIDKAIIKPLFTFRASGLHSYNIIVTGDGTSQRFRIF